MNDSTFGLILGLCTVCSWTIGTFAFTNASRLVHPSVLNHVRIAFAVILLGIISCIVGGFSPIELFLIPTLESWFWLGLSGIIGLSVGDYFGFTGLKILGSRRGSLFATLSPGAALLTGIFLLSESIGWLGLVGMFISLSGVFSVLFSRKEREGVVNDNHGNIKMGVIFGVLGAVCQGVGLVFAKKGMTGANLLPFHSAWIRMFVAVISFYTIPSFRNSGRSHFKEIFSNKKALKMTLTGVIFGPVIGVSLSLATVARIEASVAQTIFALVPVSIMIVSAAYFRENIRWETVIGVIISVIGVIILIWRDVILSCI